MTGSKKCTHCGAEGGLDFFIFQDHTQICCKYCGKITQFPDIHSVPPINPEHVLNKCKNNCAYGCNTPEMECRLKGTINPMECRLCMEWRRFKYEVLPMPVTIPTPDIEVPSFGGLSIEELGKLLVLPKGPKISEAVPPETPEEFAQKLYEALHTIDNLPMFADILARFEKMRFKPHIALQVLAKCDVGGPNCIFRIKEQYFHDIFCELPGYCGPCRQQCMNKESEVDAD